MKKLIFFLAVANTIFLVGCSSDNDLDKSVMQYDSIYTDLPSYSEWGYNTFGAYYDRAVFISNDNEIPVKVIVTNDTTTFVFSGGKGSSYYSSDDMKLSLKIANYTPSQYTDLVAFNDTTLDLANPLYKVTLTINQTKYKANIISGEFYFKRAQNLIVDKNLVEVILSGYFDFKAIVDGEPVTMSYGRFDLGIPNNNFFVY